MTIPNPNIGCRLSGVLPDGNPAAISVAALSAPATVYLNSSSGARKIEFSVDDGASFIQPTYDYSPAGQLVVFFSAPVSHVRFTGAAADTWGVR